MTNNMKNILSLLPLLLMVTTAAAEPSKNIVLILADDRMAQLYAITGNKDYLALAKRFNHKQILSPLEAERAAVFRARRQTGLVGQSLH